MQPTFKTVPFKTLGRDTKITSKSCLNMFSHNICLRADEWVTMQWVLSGMNPY